MVSGVFVGCQFEMDSCEWKDVSVGQFSWQRGRNGTASDNTGPSVDHTTGTELGKSLLYTDSLLVCFRENQTQRKALKMEKIIKM